MKKLFTLLLSLCIMYTMSGQAVITAVFDGPLPGGTPKGIEVYFTADVADLSTMGISSANNGTGPTGTPEYLFSGSAIAGQYIYVGSETDNFTAFFGFAPDFVDGVANINGDDAIELFSNGIVIDVFGDVNVDGTDQAWEYLDGWAARNANTGPDGSTFVLGNWQYSGIDALDGETSNATAANPVPLKSYTGGMVAADHEVTVRNFEYVAQNLIVDVGDIVEWENIEGNHNVNGSQATFPQNTEDFLSGAVAPAPWTYQYTFTQPGYNEYRCDQHFDIGMTGSVMVREVGDHYVEVLNNVFVPEDITIELGETVVWTNTSGFHNVNGTQGTFPNNPVGFGNGAASENWTYAHTFTIAGTYDYQCDPHVGLGMVGTVTVTSAYPERDITTIKQIDGDGAALFVDSLAAITGVVHGPDYRGAANNGVEFYVLDEDNNGVYVRTTSNNTGYTVTEGDRVTVSGEVTQFRGLIQMAPDVISVLSQGNPLNTPDVVTAPREETEGSFIRINDLILVDTAQWPTPGNNANVQALSGADTIIIRIDRDIGFDLAAPLGQFDVRGLGGQFDSDNMAPFDDGYQIFPRGNGDILDGSDVQTIESIGIEKMYPNPVVDELVIESAIDIEDVVIYDRNGKQVQMNFGSSKIVNIDLSALNSGIYILSIKTAEGIGSSRIMKQ